jgi:hypothetical protein
MLFIDFLLSKKRTKDRAGVELSPSHLEMLRPAGGLKPGGGRFKANYINPDVLYDQVTSGLIISKPILK